MHATEFAKSLDKVAAASMIALHGSERHLKHSVVAQLCESYLGCKMEDSIGLTQFAGKDTDFRTVRDELAMVSMFSPKKLVLVEDAEDFVSQYRSQLETLADKSNSSSLLILDVKTWRKNTKLAKKVAKTGIDVDCSELAGGQLAAWLVRTAKEEHGKQLTRDAAQLMMELAGTGLGLLDQELRKLSTYVGDRNRINAEDVQTLVGGWKAETTWTMVNAMRDGNVDVALSCLRQLLHAGEPAPKILGGVNFVFRKLAEATERSRQGTSLRVALKEAGVFPREIDAAEQYLRRVKRPRAERILHKLADTDYNLKGGSNLPDHLQLEDLVLWLSGAVPQT